MLISFVESFNGRFRDEFLNEHMFGSLAEAQGKMRGLAKPSEKIETKERTC